MAAPARDPDLEGFLALLAATRAPRTVDAYRRDLLDLAAHVERPLKAVTTEEIERYLAELRAAGRSPATIARRTAAARSFYRHLMLLGARSDNPAAAIALPRKARRLPRTLSPSEYSRTWYRQNPPLPRTLWSQRNNNNYEETGLLTALQYFANNKQLFLKNFYLKSKRSIEKPKTEGPAAYVFPADDPRPGTQAELLRVLQLQGCEISRATAPFTVTLNETLEADTELADEVCAEGEKDYERLQRSRGK